MRCSIVSIGTEILFGQITNTNSVYLSQKLNELGLSTYFHFSVGDNQNRLQDILNYAMKHSDIIITTGGLGPTQDDLTKEVIAHVMNRTLEFHKPSYDHLCSFFKKIHKEMTANNRKQAYLPKGCIPIHNEVGTAPGFIIEGEQNIIISLPGPPREMKHMFEMHVENYLSHKSNGVIYSKVLRLFGIGESNLETVLLDLITNQSNPTIATYAKEGEVSVRVTANGNNTITAKKQLEPIVDEITRRLREYIYSYEDEELVETVGRGLIEKGLSISIAESCTGGLINAKLTSVPGISQSLNRGFVTYSNESKIEELGVEQQIIFSHGAVSEETAKAMVIGLKSKTDSDICLAVTGIAGPGGGSKDKPVGLVFIASMYKNKVDCYKYHLTGDRERIRNYSCLLALNIIRKLLES